VEKLFPLYQDLEAVRGQMQGKKQDARMLELQKRAAAMEVELQNVVGNRA